MKAVRLAKDKHARISMVVFTGPGNDTIVEPLLLPQMGIGCLSNFHGFSCFFPTLIPKLTLYSKWILNSKFDILQAMSIFCGVSVSLNSVESWCSERSQGQPV